MPRDNMLSGADDGQGDSVLGRNRQLFVPCCGHEPRIGGVSQTVWLDDRNGAGGPARRCGDFRVQAPTHSLSEPRDVLFSRLRSW